MPLIQRELSHPTVVDLSALAELIGRGANFRPAALNGTTKNDFISQQIFAIDFDNKYKDKDTGEDIILGKSEQITPDKAKALARENGYLPVFAYFTHSNSDDVCKFRMVFVLDQPVTAPSDMSAILALLQCPYKNVPGWIDPVAKDSARVFYGGHSGLLFYDESNIISRDAILSSCTSEEASVSAPALPKIQAAPHMYLSSQEVSLSVCDALRTKNASFFKSRFNCPETIFSTRHELYDWILHDLPLDQLLNVTSRVNFRCILHDDHHPSANIFRDSHGIWRYHCFSASCNADYNAKQLIEKVCGFHSEYDTVRFVCDIFNLSVKETESTIRQRANIELILRHLTSDDEDAFSVICPTADKTTRSARRLFMQILTLAQQTISPESIESDPGSILFYMSMKQLMRISGSTSKNYVNQRLRVLLYHKMIEVVPDEDLPKEILSAALKSRASSSHNHIGFYKIPSFVVERTMLIESRGVQWKQHGYRVSSVNYELIYREDPALAAEMYPQTKNIIDKNGKITQRSTTNRQDHEYDDVMEAALRLIADYGYTTERNIINDLVSKKGYGYYRAKSCVQRDIHSIIDANLLIRKKANLKDKEIFQMIDKGYPIIITK